MNPINARGTSTMLDDIPRLLRREWKHRKPHLQRSTSLPLLAPAPHFYFSLLDRPPRPVFTCRQCGFSNTLLDMCLWCCWTSPEAKAEWAQSEERYQSMKIQKDPPAGKPTKDRQRLSRKISAPPRVYWQPPTTFKYMHPSRRSEPPPVRSSGIRFDLSTLFGTMGRSVASQHHKMKYDGAETVAEMRGGGGATCVHLPAYPSIHPLPVTVKATPYADRTAGEHKHDDVLSASQTVSSPCHRVDNPSPLPITRSHHSRNSCSSQRASSVRIILPPRTPSPVNRISSSPSSYDSDTVARPRSRAYYTPSRRTIIDSTSPESTHTHIPSSPPSSLRSAGIIPRIRIPSTFHRTSISSPTSSASSPASPASTASIPATTNMTIVHDYTHDKYTHDNSNNIHVTTSAPIPTHFHSDTCDYVYSNSILKGNEHESLGLSVAGRSFMDLSADLSVEQTMELEREVLRCHAESPPPEVVVLPSSPMIEASSPSSGSSVGFPTIPLAVQSPAKTVANASGEVSHTQLNDSGTISQVLSMKGRRSRERASAPPPTLHGLQFLDFSDDANCSGVLATHSKAHSISGLPARARSQVTRKREGVRVPRPGLIVQNTGRDCTSHVGTYASTILRERSPTHGRSKSQPTSSIKLGSPRRPYYSAIRPHMGVEASSSPPSSPIRTTYESRPSSRGASSRPGSLAAHLSTSYPTSRASSPAPSSCTHTHPKSKSFLDIDVLDDEEYLFSSLTPPSSLPPVYAQACATSDPHLRRTGLSFTGLGLGLGSGVFGNPEAAIGPRPTSSMGFRESRDTSRSDVHGSIADAPRLSSTTSRLRRDKFSLSRVWRKKGWGTLSSRLDILHDDADESGVRSRREGAPKHGFTADLGRIKDIGMDVGKIGVEGVTEQMKKVGRGLKGLKSLVSSRRTR